MKIIRYSKNIYKNNNFYKNNFKNSDKNTAFLKIKLILTNKKDPKTLHFNRNITQICNT